MVPSEKLVHTVLLGIHIFILYLIKLNTERVNNSYAILPEEVHFLNKTKNRFYTNWGFICQCIYIVIITLSHVLGQLPNLSKGSKLLRKFADLLFTTLVATNALFITTLFWSFFAYDRELIFQSSLDEFIPWWINHSLHTFNSILVIVDMLLTKHKFPCWSVFAKIISTYAAVYFVFFVDTKLRYGRYVYKICDLYGPVQVGLLFAVNFCLVFLFHGAVRCICKWRWGPEITGTSSAEKRVKVQ